MSTPVRLELTMSFITSSVTRVVTLAILLGSLSAGVAFAFAAHDVPLKGKAAGSVVNVNPTSEGVVLTLHASGTATQLGNFDRVEELLLDPSTGAVSGSIVFIAANLDELHVTVDGGFISETTAVGSYEIVGGTGRFAGATGNATFVAESPDGVAMTVTFKGTMSSVGG
jgi:hypothetical protein